MINHPYIYNLYTYTPVCEFIYIRAHACARPGEALRWLGG